MINDTEGEDAVLDSVSKFKEHGGGCILDNSSLPKNRKSGFLKKLSQETGVHIIAGTGFYVEGSHSQETVRTSTVESMTRHLTKEISEGCIDDQTVKCGFIGEIGVSETLKGI